MEVLAQWPLDDALPPLFKDTRTEGGPSKGPFMNALYQRILSLFPDERTLTIHDIYGALAAQNASERSHMRVAVFRLVRAGKLAKNGRGVFSVPTAIKEAW